MNEPKTHKLLNAILITCLTANAALAATKPAPKSEDTPHQSPSIGVSLGAIDAVEATSFRLDNESEDDALCSLGRQPWAGFRQTVTEGETRKLVRFRANVGLVCPGATPVRFKAVQVALFRRQGRTGWAPFAKAYCGDVKAFGLKAPERGSIRLELRDARGNRLEDSLPVLNGKSSGCFKIAGEADVRQLGAIEGSVRAEVSVATSCNVRHAHKGNGRTEGDEYIESQKTALEFNVPKARRVNDRVLLTEWVFSKPRREIAASGDIDIVRPGKDRDERCGRIPASGIGSFVREIRATGKSGTRWTFRSRSAVRFRTGACGSTSLGTVAFLVGRGGCPDDIKVFSRRIATASMQLLARGCGERPGRGNSRSHGHRCNCHCGTPPPPPPATVPPVSQTPTTTTLPPPPADSGDNGSNGSTTPPATPDDSHDSTATHSGDNGGSDSNPPPPATPDDSHDSTATHSGDNGGSDSNPPPPATPDDSHDSTATHSGDGNGSDNQAGGNGGSTSSAAIQAGDFETFTQGGWGAKAHGNNPGTLRDSRFAAAFPAGLTIGGAFHVTFASAQAVANFLPQGGAAAALDASSVDPESTSAGVLAGQLVAATLNVTFSAAGYLAQNDARPLGNLLVASGPFAGTSVNALLELANRAIGGDSSALPPGAGLSDLNDALTRVNECFDNGTENTGYLRKP
ncbi:MAG: hypothetical protein HY303_00935 [Candidatus Wallbacteria bacterium]|nr:hypothetical protein [Candidatus Wallbacteria bacterium]